MFTIKEARKTFRHPLGILWGQCQTTALKWLLSNEAQVLDVSLQKEFTERQSDR